MRLYAKVLVVGGGPAGSTAASFLAKNRIEVVLLEKDPAFVKPCGGAVPLSAFEELCIPRALMKKEVNSVRIVSPKGERLDVGLRDGNLAIVARGEFDRSLRNSAEEQGARLLEGEFIRIVNRRNTYSVEAIIDGAKAEIISDYIIAADGVNSKVRSSLGIKPSRTFFTVSESIKGIEAAVCEFWFGSYHAPGSYSWVFPAPEGISTGTGSLKPGEINVLFDRFRERRGITVRGLKRIYRIPRWDGNLYNKGRVIFTGDAAGLVMPLIYEGIYYAMKSGEFAAAAIEEGKAENYKKNWKARFQKRYRLMDRLRDYFLRDDASAERLFSLHRRPEILEASLRLWIKKDSSMEGLKDYIKLIGKFLS